MEDFPMSVKELRAKSPLRIISDEEIKKIHLAVLEILEDVGVKIEYKPALELLKDAGCRVDFDTRIVRIPEHILNKALATAPSKFTLYGVSPEWNLEVDTENIYTIGGSSALEVLDLDGNRRPAVLRDLADLTRIQDSLENLHIMHAIVNPQDIPQYGLDRILFATVIQNTTRNYYSQGQGADSIKDQIELASIVRGSVEEAIKRPPFTIVTCLISPLVQPKERVAEIMEAAKYRIPIYIEVDAQMGSTTPITIAGTLVEQTANVLTGVTIAQLSNPGAPCIYAIASGAMDLRTGSYTGSSPEADILHMASARVAHFYNLPFQGCTSIDAKIPDAQAGYERALQVLSCALGSVNFIHLSIGMMDQMLLASHEQCLIDDEILGAAFRIVKGFEVNRDTLAVDVIKDVGPGGNFLTHPHTLKYMRKEHWAPNLTFRGNYHAWEEMGRKDIRQRANEQAKEILETHYPNILGEAQKRELDALAKRQQRRVLEDLGMST